jgi:putative oxidoreductase
MFTSLQTPLALAGRILLASIFLLSGIGKVTGFQGTVAYIASKGLPLAELGAMIAAAVEIGGAIAVIVGWRTQWAALMLAVYTLVTAVIFHNFWAVPAAQLAAQQVQFLKNISMAGGLLTLMAWGAGSLSLDARKKH